MVSEILLLLLYHVVHHLSFIGTHWYFDVFHVSNFIVLLEQNGFTFNGDVCYYISTEKKNWQQSREYCRDKQSDLIIINSNGKQVWCVRACVHVL